VTSETLQLFDASALEPPWSRSETAGEVQAEVELRQVADSAKLAAQAQARFARAVAAAREAGYSWRRIGKATGIPHQTLHRQFAGQSVGAMNLGERSSSLLCAG
jgi:hypothetical protein